MENRVKSWVPANRRPEWRPALGAHVKGKSTQEVGLAILSALSITSVWSSVCPSYFTFKTFGTQPEARPRAEQTCWIGFALSTATAGAIWLVFDEFIPALVAEATAIALLGISMYAIRSEAPKTIPPIEKQNTTEVAIQGNRVPRFMGSQVVYSR